jgi:16S rRNA (cytosine1402-N4)-methyltransferase
MTEFAHITVLLRETVDGVLPGPGKLFVDATLGGGGHSEALLEASGPDGRLIGIDRDPAALVAAGERLARFGDRVRLVHGTFGEIARVVRELGETAVDGIIADLGVSSPQLDHDERGFSFARSGPLDMRMNPEDEPLSELLERLSVDELANVLYELGDERKSRAIARSIKAAPHHGRPAPHGGARARAKARRHRSRDAHVPGPAHGRQRRAAAARILALHGARLARARWADGHHLVPLRRRPAGETHVSRRFPAPPARQASH